MIAEAACSIGLENVTMKTVADHLGVSVPGLYHHVKDKDDLLRLTAEYSAARMVLPHDHGQHWAVWLYEWAVYSRDVFVVEPALLKQLLDGAIGADRTADRLDTAMGTLVRQGFSVGDARTVYELIGEVALGAAVGEIREQQATVDGRPSVAEFHRVLAQRDPSELPNLRAMLAEPPVSAVLRFHGSMLTVLRGVAAERGERWAPIESKLRGFADRPAPAGPLPS
jgi:AcrR family transcriptional regulator